MKQLELSTILGRDARVLIGHQRGLAVREAMRLDELDRDADPVQVVVPPTVSTLTPSFVQGLFAASIHALGEDRFYNHYKFSNNAIFRDIKAGVDRILTSRHL